MKTIQISDIKELDRQRQDYPNIPRLAHSIINLGLLQPIVLNKDNVLVAGGRRKTALQYILNKEIEIPDDLAERQPALFAFTVTGGLIENELFRYQSSLTEDADREEAELAENLEREDLSWQETALAIDRIHRLKVKQNAILGKSWGQKETADLLGSRTSHSKVHYISRIAKYLRANDSEVWKASGVTEAYKLLLARTAADASNKLAEKLAEAEETVFDQIQVSSPPPVPGEQSAENVSNDVVAQLFGGNKEECDAFYEHSEAQSRALADAKADEENKPTKQIEFSTKFRCGKMEDVFKGKTEICDHIITDPPYAIDMRNLKQDNKSIQNVKNVEATHDVEQNLADFPVWIETMYNMLRNGGFLIMWCDDWYFRHVADIAAKVGFGVQRWSLKWVKTHSCINQAATKNFTKTSEVALVARKGNAVLAKPAQVSHWIGSNESERKNFYGHPFVKPFGLTRWVAEHIAVKGQTIADPFVGVGSIYRALISEGYNVIGSEVDGEHFKQLRETCYNYYSKTFPDNVIILK